MAHSGKSSESEAMRRAAEMEKEAKLSAFVKEQDGKVARLFLERAGLVQNWLTTIRPSFQHYKRTFDDLKKYEQLKPRLPQSKLITQLSLDVSPEVSDLLTELPKAKTAFYESIRSSRIKKGTTQKLNLDKDERSKLISQLNYLAPAIDQPSVDWSKLFFPDESFSLSASDITDPKKEIDFKFTDYFFNINTTINRIKAELKKQEPKNPAIRINHPDEGVFKEADWEDPNEVILESDRDPIPTEGDPE